MIIVVVDMWDRHWCKAFSKRLDAFVPHVNRALDQAREMGHTIMFMPSSVTSFYTDSIQRVASLALPQSPMPKPRQFDPVMPLGLNHWPSCECVGTVCATARVWTRMHPDLIITEHDFISESPQELYNLLCERQATRLLYVGASANLCILSRKFGVVNMIRHGVTCLVASDMVLAWSPWLALNLAPVLRHISTHIAPVVSFMEAISES